MNKDRKKESSHQILNEIVKFQQIRLLLNKFITNLIIFGNNGVINEQNAIKAP